MPVLFGAGQVPRTALLQIGFGDREAIVARLQEPQAFVLAVADQDAAPRVLAAPDATAQLVQRRQTEALGVADHDQSRFGYIHSDFDDGRRNEAVDLTRPKRLLGTLTLLGLEASVDQGGANARSEFGMRGDCCAVGPRAFACRSARRGRLALALVRADPTLIAVQFRLRADPRANDVDAGASLYALLDLLEHLRPTTLRNDPSSDRLASKGRFSQLGKVEVAVERGRHRARNRGCRHHEHVRHASVFTLAEETTALTNTESLLLIDDEKAEVRDGYAFAEKGVGANAHASDAARQDASYFALAPSPDRLGQAENGKLRTRQARGNARGVLLGQELRRRQEHRAVSSSRGRERGVDGDGRLATAYVAMQEPRHRLRVREIGADFDDATILIGRQLERQAPAHARIQGSIDCDAWRLETLTAKPPRTHFGQERRRLSKRDSATRGLEAVLVTTGAVQLAQCRA